MTALSPFDLSQVPGLLRPFLKFMLKLPLLESWYRQWQQGPISTPAGLLAFVLERLQVTYNITQLSESMQIPKTGPLVIVANHPLGAVEGIILSHHLLALRPDLKVLTNELLLRVPEFQQLFIGVDILSKQRRNKSALSALHAHLANAGALLIFPAGTVAELNLKTGKIEDAKWHHTAARLALRHNAHCLPVHIKGRNSWWFYLSGRIHKRLRTLLLPRAMLGTGRRPIDIRLGNSFKLADVGVSSTVMATDYLRTACELSGTQTSAANSSSSQAPIPELSPPASLEYLDEYVLLKRGNVVVYCAPFAALGPLQGYLAAEREKTFRKAGEGSGKAMDFDEFDLRYQHILAWDSEANKLIGGYRACKVCEGHGGGNKTGLYSRSLFNYGETFIRQFSAAIEVGRSFVCEAYQGDPRALDLLWQGLGAFMLRHPDCHSFMGCVSISANYAPLVRELFYDTLLAGYRAQTSMLTDILPAKPFKSKQAFWSQTLVKQLSSVGAINKLLGFSGLDIRVPVLIRHYLSLNGRFVDFTINEGFSQSLDGLIVVDLRNAPQRYLKRYLGTAGMALFLQQWESEDAA